MVHQKVIKQIQKQWNLSRNAIIKDRITYADCSLGSLGKRVSYAGKKKHCFIILNSCLNNCR